MLKRLQTVASFPLNSGVRDAGPTTFASHIEREGVVLPLFYLLGLVVIPNALVFLYYIMSSLLANVLKRMDGWT